jgi:HEAT repeats
MRARTLAFVALLATVGGAGCEKDPLDAQTWIDKLDDRKELNEALRRLDRLHDPRSIKPLGETWKRLNKQSNVLRTLIAVAGHVDEKTGKAQYDDAIPYLVTAVADFDPGSGRSIDDAVAAANALGQAKNPETVTTLIEAANKPLPKLHDGNRVRLAAIKALGQFRDAKAVDTLIRILLTDTDKQLLKINAAAALSLAESGDPKALPALTRAMFMPAIFPQVRAAITRIGKPAVEPMLTLLQEKDPEIQKLFKEKGFDKSSPGNVVFKAAQIVGDLRAKPAVPVLVNVLKAESRIAFYDERSGAAGPTTHEAALDALRRIGDPSAAGEVRAYFMNPKTDDGIRPFAIDAYSMFAPDASALADLWKYAKDTEQENQIRIAAIVAYGRLARTAAQAKEVDDLIKAYDERIKKNDEKIKASKNEEEKVAAEEDKSGTTYFKNALLETKSRIAVALECKEDPACYIKAIQVKDFKEERLARAERALIEIARLGDKARGLQTELLAKADTTERSVRQGILLALPRVVALPCKACATRLDEIIEKQSKESTLDLLTNETRISYHYFLWADGK